MAVRMTDVCSDLHCRALDMYATPHTAASGFILILHCCARLFTDF